MTLHEEAARDALRKCLRGPGRETFFAIEDKLGCGGYDKLLVDSVGQMHALSRGWEPAQSLMFAVILDKVAAGKIGMVDVGLWESPGSDHARERNQRILDELPDPFLAIVDPKQYGAGQDGWLSWSSPIRVSVTTGEPKPSPGVGPPTKEVLVAPGSVPLEIGYTQPSRTRLHIIEDRGVARWPYGSEKVRIFLNLEHLLPSAAWSRDVIANGCSCHERVRKGLPFLAT